MFCSSCGGELPDNIRFCTRCGSPVDRETSGEVDKAASQQKQSLIGYSERIKDPAFARYIRHSVIWIFTTAGIVSLIVIVSFFIYGERSYEMDNPEALYIGLKVAAMFITIAIIGAISKVSGSTYDALVVDKKIEKRKRRVNTENSYYIERYTDYTVSFKTDKGKIIHATTQDNRSKYDYFNIGDRVRHHKGLDTWEKYDKSKDKIIFCNACGTLHDISDDRCYRCYCPLLK